MEGKIKTEPGGDRRDSDRRTAQRSFLGEEKRVAQRRSGGERRASPRA